MGLLRAYLSNFSLKYWRWSRMWFGFLMLCSCLLWACKKDGGHDSPVPAAVAAEQRRGGSGSSRELAVTESEVVVGQLHSATGTMAISETGSIQAERLAIEQINAAGGILGRTIRIIQEDGASDWPTFAEKAKKLLVSDRVAAEFGCWTSASRKAVLPVFEKENGLLYYPTFYEGPLEHDLRARGVRRAGGARTRGPLR